MFDADEEKPKTKTNFSVMLHTDEEFEPFQALAESAGMDKTTYFRQMLRRELKEERIKTLRETGKLKK